MAKLLNSNISADKSLPIETTLAKLGSVSAAGRGALRTITDVGQGVIVQSDGVAFRGAEGFVNGLSVRNGELLLNGKYCRELGVNCYSLITDITSGSNPLNYKTCLDEMAEIGVRIVRVSLQPYSATEMTNQMHNGTVRIPSKWEDFSQSYRDAVKTVFDYAASKGMYLVPSLVWGPKFISDAFGEVLATAFANANSKTRQYIRGFAAAFANAYKNHPALGAYSVGNELPLRGEYSVVYTDTRAVIAGIARIFKTIDPSHAVLSCNLDMIYDGTVTRPTFNTQVALAIANNPDPLDTIDIHAYSDRAWLSINPANQLNSLTYPAYGYAKEWFSRFVAEGKAVGKPFTLSEIGILGRNTSDNTGQEMPGDTTKFRWLLECVKKSGVQLAMIWNYGSVVPAIQAQWDFRKGTVRGDAYLAVMKEYVNKIRVGTEIPNGYKYFDPTLTGFPKPSGCVTFDGATSHNIQYAGNGSLAGKAGTILTWIKVPAANTAFARPVGAASSDGTKGFNLVFGSDGLDLGISFRKSDNTEAINTFGKAPPLVANTWTQRGFTWDGTNKVDIYVDGFWFDAKSNAYTYSPRDNTTPFVLGTSVVGANPANCSMAGLIYCPRIMSEIEISYYYNYGWIPADAVVLPLAYDGASIGNIQISPTSIAGAGVTFAPTSLAY